MAAARPHYSVMVRSSPAGMILIASDGVIHFANARATQMFGYSSEELVGQHIEALVPARLRENHSALHSDNYEGRLPTIRLAMSAMRRVAIKTLSV